MSKVEEIQAAIEALSDDEYGHLRRWFSEREWKRWDRQIDLDAKSGKLDFLVKEALDQKAKEKLRDL